MPASESPVMRFEVLRVPGTERAAGHLRRWMRDLLGAGHPALEDAEQCLSEVVTNAVRHTVSGRGGQVRVELGYSDRAVRVEVIDDGGSEYVPRVRDMAETGESGRGLRIVAALAADWSAERRGGGHVVRFAIRP